MTRFVTQKEKLERYKGEIMPKPMKSPNWEIDQSCNWTTMYSSHKILKATHALNGEKFVVSLVDNSCSCNFWSIVGVKLLASIPIVVVGFTFIKEFVSIGT